MLNLSELALEATKNNVVKATKKECVNDALLRILFADGKKLTRIELISQISLDRLVTEHGEETLTKLATTKVADFNKLMLATNKTVKNGLDTSISNSNNNSSFSYNEKYADYKLELVQGKYQITKA